MKIHHPIANLEVSSAMKTITTSWLISTVYLLFVLSAKGQSYSVDWDVIAGGGGTTTGAGYSVNSTIGQHTAGGSLAGGGYSLAAGFWALYAVTTPGSPMLSILLSDTNTVVVAWPAALSGWTLQQNTDLLYGRWVSLSNTVNAVTGQNQSSFLRRSAAAFTGSKIRNLNSPKAVRARQKLRRRPAAGLKMVGETGLEPARVSPRGPKPRASAISPLAHKPPPCRR